jgi:excisionase family DNA binding protein
METQIKQSWTPEQAAQRLGLSPWQTSNLARQKVLPHFYVGRLLRFDPEQIEAFIRGGGQRFEHGWRKRAR